MSVQLINTVSVQDGIKHLTEKSFLSKFQFHSESTIIFSMMRLSLSFITGVQLSNVNSFSKVFDIDGNGMYYIHSLSIYSLVGTLSKEGDTSRDPHILDHKSLGVYEGLPGGLNLR